MTKKQAIEWVYGQDESQPEVDQVELAAAFKALYGREPDEDDHREGLWSHCCAAAPNCGTRPKEGGI